MYLKNLVDIPEHVDPLNPEDFQESEVSLGARFD